MTVTQARGSNQIKDLSVTKIKLVADFLAGSDWDITNGANNATITGLNTPVNPSDVAIKSYVDGLVDASLKQPEAYDPTITGDYPTTYAGNTIQAGDSFRITANGTMGTVDVNVEDLLIALVDGAGANNDADWMVAESNRDQATEAEMGVAKIATQAIVDAGTNDTDFVTALKLATFLNTGKLTHYSNELPTVTDGSPDVSALTNLGTHAIDKVVNVEVYLNGLKQSPGAGNDYTLDSTSGVISFTSNLVTGDVVNVDYDSQDA